MTQLDAEPVVRRRRYAVYGMRRYAARTARLRHSRGKLPCAPGAHDTQAADTRVPYAQYGGPETGRGHVSACGAERDAVLEVQHPCGSGDELLLRREGALEAGLPPVSLVPAHAAHQLAADHLEHVLSELRRKAGQGEDGAALVHGAGSGEERCGARRTRRNDARMCSEGGVPRGGWCAVRCGPCPSLGWVTGVGGWCDCVGHGGV